ncbi:hypothetical protein EMPG_16438 [Blastomyces silverae]|uniref:Uncharacterized protein n=1 Tax=Blastomyces silverae TaxID=2060906 RepID=A0A0H1BFZ6_9EURO|nr:hypothetical protein EMPG_16438 [Blastomyces silverae]
MPRPISSLQNYPIRAVVSARFAKYSKMATPMRSNDGHAKAVANYLLSRRSKLSMSTILIIPYSRVPFQTRSYGTARRLVFFLPTSVLQMVAGGMILTFLRLRERAWK